MLKRQLADFGIQPFVGLVIVATAFFGCSFLLFNRSNYAAYIYVVTALSFLYQHSETQRNEFLKFHFSRKLYYSIRILENVITGLPFIIFLSVKREIVPMFLLFIIIIALAMINHKKYFSPALPTPFNKRPFEFIAGFRRSIFILIAAYFIGTMAIIYNNFHLGISSLLFIFLICLSFYNEPEEEFYVWIHKQKVSGFIFSKIKTAIFCSTMLTLPVSITLLAFFTTHSLLIAVVQVLGYVYLTNMILAKYAAFPLKINLPQGILLVVSFLLSPLLLATIPFFYFQSRRKLKHILDDNN